MGWEEMMTSEYYLIVCVILFAVYSNDEAPPIPPWTEPSPPSPVINPQPQTQGTSGNKPETRGVSPRKKSFEGLSIFKLGEQVSSNISTTIVNSAHVFNHRNVHLMEQTEETLLLKAD